MTYAITNNAKPHHLYLGLCHDRAQRYSWGRLEDAIVSIDKKLVLMAVEALPKRLRSKCLVVEVE